MHGLLVLLYLGHLGTALLPHLELRRVKVHARVEAVDEEEEDSDDNNGKR